MSLTKSLNCKACYKVGIIPIDNLFNIIHE